MGLLIISALQPMIRALSSQSPSVLRSSLIAGKTVSKGLIMMQKNKKNREIEGRELKEGELNVRCVCATFDELSKLDTAPDN